MRFSFAFSALLLGELAYAEYDARNAFKKAERTIPATPEHPRLNKRASPFYTEKTKRRSKCNVCNQGQALTVDRFLGERQGYPRRAL